MAGHDWDRLLRFWRGRVNGKLDSGSVLQWKCPEAFKRGAEACWVGTLHAQLPCQQGERTVGMICSHSVQQGRLVEGVQNKVVLQPQPGTTVHSGGSGGCGPQCAVRVVGWELFT